MPHQRDGRQTYRDDDPQWSNDDSGDRRGRDSRGGPAQRVLTRAMGDRRAETAMSALSQTRGAAGSARGRRLRKIVMRLVAVALLLGVLLVIAALVLVVWLIANADAALGWLQDTSDSLLSWMQDLTNIAEPFVTFFNDLGKLVGG